MSGTGNSQKYTLYSAFVDTVRKWGDRIFMRDKFMSLSFSGTLSRVNQVSGILRTHHQVNKNDRVGVFVSNRMEYVITILALNKLGACFAPMDTMCKAQDVLDILRAMDMKLFIYEKRFEMVKAGSPVCRSLALEELFAADGTAGDDSFEPHDIAAIFFTSGTTGKSKGVLLGNETFFNSAKIISEGSEYIEGMKQLIIAPLHHAYPFHNQLAPGILMGHTLYLANYESVGQVMNILAKEVIDMILASPPVYTLIVFSGLSVKYKLPGAKIFGYSGAPMKREIIESLRDAYPHVKMVNSCGSTEAGGTYTVLPAAKAVEKADSVGRAGPGITIRVLDEENKFITDKIGEIVVKTVHMKGYVNADSSGRFYGEYLRTGDLGLVSHDGYVYLKGRVDDMMIVNGTNVYPADVEKYFSTSSLVKDIAVLARKSLFGDQVVAFVVPAGGKDGMLEKLNTFARENIPQYKRPIDYIFVDRIPRNATGKTLRRELETLL